MTADGRRPGTLLGAITVAAAVVLWSPPLVAACSGGMAFDWAVAHTRGWIATARVVEAEYVPIGFYRVVLGGVEPVMGRPPALRQVTVAMGAVCDQSPDAGERILLLDGVAVQPPYDRPVVYVISGADAIPAADVARALGSLPATDSASAAIAASTRPGDAAPWLLTLGLGAAWLAMRWFARRTADPVHSSGGRPNA